MPKKTKAIGIPFKYRELLLGEEQDEQWLTKNIIIPLFEKMQFQPQYTHGPGEIHTKTDILAFWGNESFMIAIQVKHKKNVRTNSDYSKIAGSARKAISQGITHCNKQIPVNKFYWITTGSRDLANSSAKEEEEFNKFPELRNRIEIWDIRELFKQLSEHYPEAFTTTQIEYYHQLREKYKASNPIAASFCSYKIMALSLKITDDVERTIQSLSAIREAIGLVEVEKEKKCSPFYKRTLAAFFKQWLQLLEDENLNSKLSKLLYKKGYCKPEREEEQDDLERKYILTQSLHELFKEDKIPAHYLLLSDVQYILDHLNILYLNYANAPSGLSSLQIIRLLLRVGFPYINESENPVHKRLERVSKELDNLRIFESYKNGEHDHCKGNSIDGGCTICTSTALSCFALAGDALPDNLKTSYNKMLQWLTSEEIRKKNWIYIIYDQLEASPENHAMNYTASVLLSFLDSSVLLKNGNKACFDSFFKPRNESDFSSSPEKDKNGFVQYWLTYRNERPEEVIQYIFSSLIKVYLSYPELFKHPGIFEILKDQLAALYNTLKDSSENVDLVWQLYATRECIECLCFMFILDQECGLVNNKEDKENEVYNEILGTAKTVIERFRLQIKHLGLRESRIFDSNIDRSRKFLEGWLTYWEVTLFLSEKN